MRRREKGKEQGKKGIWARLLSPLLAGIGASFMAFTSLAARQSKSTEVKAICVGEGRSVCRGRGIQSVASVRCPMIY